MSKIRKSPFGGRGERPFIARARSDREWRTTLETIPGCSGDITSGQIDIPYDLTGCFSHVELPKVSRRDRVRLRTGIERFRSLGFHRILWPSQRKTILDLELYDYHVIALALRGGKTLTSLALCTLRGARHITIFVPSYLRPTWFHEIRRWFPSSKIVTLEGRRGDKCRISEPGKRARLTHSVQSAIEAMRGADFVLSSYDLLVSQNKRTGSGKTKYLPDLLGMGPSLFDVPTDALLLDESQEIAGHMPSGERMFTRGDILWAIYRDRRMAKLAYALSGTPLGIGTPLKTWNTWRIIAGGYLWDGKHWGFAARYCDGKYVPNVSGYGPPEVWDESGLSNVEEFQARWARLVYYKTAKELEPDMPDVVHSIFRIDPGAAKWRVPKSVLSSEAKQNELAERAATFKAKSQGVLHEFRKCLESGQKIQIMTVHRPPLKAAKAALEASVRRSPIPELRIYYIDGTVPPETRRAFCEAIKAYEGPVALYTTTTAVRGGLSLRGIASVHHLEIDSRPDVFFQATGRGRERGCADISSILYAIDGSYDAAIMDRLLPRLEALAEIEGSPDAKNTRQAVIEATKQDLASVWVDMAGQVADAALEQLDD